MKFIRGLKVDCALYSLLCSVPRYINQMVAHLSHFDQFRMTPIFVYTLLWPGSPKTYFQDRQEAYVSPNLYF